MSLPAVRLLQRHIAAQGWDLTRKRSLFKPFLNRQGPILPYEIELQLGDRCDLACTHCEGKHSPIIARDYVPEAIMLTQSMGGRVPLFILSGFNTDPTRNPKLIDVIEAVEQSGSAVGLHTHGTSLLELEASQDFLSRFLFAVAVKTRRGRPKELQIARDYVSVSLDAGYPKSYREIKGKDCFESVVFALQEICRMRKEISNCNLAVRVTYLLHPQNSSLAEIETVVNLMKTIKPDSLRFSVPYLYFGAGGNECRRYRDQHEIPFYKRIRPILERFERQRTNRLPVIFALPPKRFQNIDRWKFHQCANGYYMGFCVGTDGYAYRCSSSVYSPAHRLGPLTFDPDDIYLMILRNQQPDFDPTVSCFPLKVRCTRPAGAINNAYILGRGI